MPISTLCVQRVCYVYMFQRRPPEVGAGGERGGRGSKENEAFREGRRGRKVGKCVRSPKVSFFVSFPSQCESTGGKRAAVFRKRERGKRTHISRKRWKRWRCWRLVVDLTENRSTGDQKGRGAMYVCT